MAVIHSALIKNFLILMKRKNVSACDRRKPNSCNPKNDFDRDFFGEGTMYNGNFEVASLVYIYMYMYVLFPCGTQKIQPSDWPKLSVL